MYMHIYTYTYAHPYSHTAHTIEKRESLEGKREEREEVRKRKRRKGTGGNEKEKKRRDENKKEKKWSSHSKMSLFKKRNVWIEFYNEKSVELDLRLLQIELHSCIPVKRIEWNFG